MPGSFPGNHRPFLLRKNEAGKSHCLKSEGIGASHNKRGQSAAAGITVGLEGLY